MFIPKVRPLAISLLFAGSSMICGAAGNNEVPYTSWTSGVKKHPVAALQNRHVIHSYYSISPESPDGRYVLYYTSGVANGEQGDLRILERSTGKETIIAQNITAEDAHRAACQQWTDNGKMVVYHDCRKGKWTVIAVDMATLKEKVLAEDRQVGFSYPKSVWVPIYGCHWNPGAHRDLELVNVETGEIRTAVTADAVVEKYGDWIKERLGEGTYSIYAAMMSPDDKKVFFKMARSNGGTDFRSAKASVRDGKFVYDLENKQFLHFFESWGHPSWHPDSREIFEKGNILSDATTGTSERYVPGSPSDHPSISPDGKLFITDGKYLFLKDGKVSKSEKEWVVIVGNPKGNEFTILDKFDNTQGATSWRHNHPHPVFSADGHRIYYNVNDGPWTRLMVAEAAESANAQTP
jgi:Tol biopolymer transport system component